MNTTTRQLAKHLREVHFGGNWTWVNMKDTLKDVTWTQANTKVHTFNTIGVLVFHINYYIDAVLKVLKGEHLNANDKFAFGPPVINSQEDWEKLLEKVWAQAEDFAELVEQLPDSRLYELLADEKYGTWFRNLLGIIEHTHYHLGQITLIKKILAEQGIA